MSFNLEDGKVIIVHIYYIITTWCVCVCVSVRLLLIFSFTSHVLGSVLGGGRRESPVKHGAGGARGGGGHGQGWHHAVFYYRVLFGFLIKPDSLRGSKIGFYSVLFPDKCFNAWLTSHARSGRPPIPATARTPTDIILLSVY
jgi:hypothetical protein